MSPKFRYEMQFPFKPIFVSIVTAFVVGYLLGTAGFGSTSPPGCPAAEVGATTREVR
ncbi:hypothetical protein [Saccharopolyspora rosea]|uniref:Uncharacterized protein n=1 Tax=Saccharopolyspora rosea TaxID=524884 RepID=A0ABW3FVR6_9PSEU|nr:hypothetical protein [Saccharopolyspora rosea]